MLKVEGNAIFRSGIKVGYVENGHVIDRSGKKVGYYSGDHVFSEDGRKLASLEGDFIYFMDSGHKMRIEDNNSDVVGGNLTNLEKAAARILFGE